MVNGLELITLALSCFRSFPAFPGVVGVHNYGKSIVIKGEEKKMDINTKKVKLVKYSSLYFQVLHLSSNSPQGYTPSSEVGGIGQ